MKFFLLALWCFALPAVAQQSLNIAPITAERGDTLSCTYTIRGNACSRIQNTFYFCPRGTQKDIFGSTKFSWLNDSTVQLFFNVPMFFLDGTVLSLIGIRASCGDTIVVDTAITIQGGYLPPSVVAISPDTMGRGDTINFKVDITGSKIMGQKMTSIRIWGQNHLVYLQAPDAYAINDSQIVGSFRVPKDLPDGKYNVDITTSGMEMFFYSFARLTISGGKNIPYIDFVSPNSVGRGDEKLIRIHTKGTEFLRENPLVVIENREVENFIVENDTTLTCTLKVSTGREDGFIAISVSSYYDGELSLDSAIAVMGGKGLAKIKLDHEYMVKCGQKIKVLVKGEHVRFTKGNIGLDVSGSSVMITQIEIIDSVTLYAYLEVENEVDHYGYMYLTYKDQDVLEEIIVENKIIVLPNETQAYVSKMDPPYLHYNTTLYYTFTIRNVNLTLLDFKDQWNIGAYTVLNNQYPEIVGFSIINDSMMRVSIRLDESVTDPVAAIHFYYHSPDGNITFKTFANTIIVNTGITENGNQTTDPVSVYPNPTSDKLYVETNMKVHTFRIMDITGKQTVIDPTEFKQDPTHFVVPIDKLGLRSGIYFIRLESENGVDVKKFIVQ